MTTSPRSPPAAAPVSRELALPRIRRLTDCLLAGCLLAASLALATPAAAQLPEGDIVSDPQGLPGSGFGQIVAGDAFGKWLWVAAPNGIQVYGYALPDQPYGPLQIVIDVIGARRRAARRAGPGGLDRRPLLRVALSAGRSRRLDPSVSCTSRDSAEPTARRP